MPTMSSCCNTKADKCVNLVNMCFERREKLGKFCLTDIVLQKTTNWSNTAPRVLHFTLISVP